MVVTESERVVSVAWWVDFFPDLVIEDKELVEPFSGGYEQCFFGIADMDARVRFDETGGVFHRIDLVSLTPVSSVQKFSEAPDAFIEEVIRLDESGRDGCTRCEPERSVEFVFELADFFSDERKAHVLFGCEFVVGLGVLVEGFSVSDLIDDREVIRFFDIELGDIR